MRSKLSKYPFRVIEVSPGVRPVFGETGADAVAIIVRDLAENLGRLGICVTVLDVLPRHAFDSPSPIAGNVEVIRIRNPLSSLVRRGYSSGAGKNKSSMVGLFPSLEGWVGLAFTIVALIKLTRLLSIRRREDKVIVHVHNFWQAILVNMFKKLLSFRVVYTTHNHGVLMPSKNLDPSFKDFFLEKLALEKSDFVVTPSPPVALNVTRFFGVPPSKVLAIPFGIDPSDYPLSDDRTVENFDILYVARIQRRKNQMVLLQALELLQFRGYRFTLEMAGPIEETDYYEKLVQYVRQKRLNVRFLGEVSREKLKRLYSGATLVAIPSLQETQCLVLFEALASAKPVVASRIEPFISLIRQNSTCVRFASPDDPVQWASIIAELMSDPKLLRTMGESARILVTKNFSIENTTRNYIKVFQSLM